MTRDQWTWLVLFFALVGLCVGVVYGDRVGDVRGDWWEKHPPVSTDVEGG